MGDLLTDTPEVQNDADEKTDLTKEDTFVWAKLAGFAIFDYLFTVFFQVIRFGLDRLFMQVQQILVRKRDMSS